MDTDFKSKLPEIIPGEEPEEREDTIELASGRVIDVTKNNKEIEEELQIDEKDIEVIEW